MIFLEIEFASLVTLFVLPVLQKMFVPPARQDTIKTKIICALLVLKSALHVKMGNFAQLAKQRGFYSEVETFICIF